jgi:hypothetical protein
VRSVSTAGTGAGLEIKEFCRKEEPSTLEVRVGFVRVCRDEFLTFEVNRVVLMVVDMGTLFECRQDVGETSRRSAVTTGQGHGNGRSKLDVARGQRCGDIEKLPQQCKKRKSERWYLRRGVEARRGPPRHEPDQRRSHSPFCRGSPPS